MVRNRAIMVRNVILPASDWGRGNTELGDC